MTLVMEPDTFGASHSVQLERCNHEMITLQRERPSTNLDIINKQSVVEQETSSWTERKPIKRRYLSTTESASLIVNKMIGTGILTTPGLILELTHNKSLALVLWVIGALYAALCLFIYLDYGTGLPYNGAELIYLNRVYSYTKFKLLPPVLYASYFVSLYHTAGNALAFSRFVIITAETDDSNVTYQLSPALVKELAVLTLAVICFLLWVHEKTGLVLSKAFAAFKLLLLFVLGFMGVAARNKTKDKSPMQDWGYHDGQPGDHTIARLAGFIYVVYSYGGWESACYVIGEFDKSSHSWIPKIRWGAMSAVLLVGLAYTILVLGFYASCTYEDILSKKGAGDLGIAQVFADGVLPSPDVVKVCIALSGFGNLIAVAYTSTKVKQAIALHHFLPYSTFLGSDKPFNTPGGALLLHWIVSSIFILSVPANRHGYSFLIGLLTYGQLIVAALVGLGRFRLKRAVLAAQNEFSWKPWVPSDIINFGAGFVLCAVNILIAIVSVWPTTPRQEDTDHIPTYLWAVVVFSCLLGGLIYWCGLQLLQGWPGEWLGWRFKIVSTEEESDLDRYVRWTRRDGTEKRYAYEELEPGTIAYNVRHAWKWFWLKLSEVL